MNHTVNGRVHQTSPEATARDLMSRARTRLRQAKAHRDAGRMEQARQDLRYALIFKRFSWYWRDRSPAQEKRRDEAELAE